MPVTLWRGVKAEQTLQAQRKHEQEMEGKIDHITPDDPRFAEIAASCTDISKIRSRHGMEHNGITAKEDKGYVINRRSIGSSTVI